MLTPRVRRFLLLVLVFAAFAAFTVLTPMRVWAGIMMGVLLGVLLVVFWWIAKDPWPWKRPWRRA